MDINTLKAISPIDGRYRKITDDISKYFSEFSYIKYRVLVEVEWLKVLLQNKNIVKDDIKLNAIEGIYKNFNIDDATRVKEIENKTNHDVKAIEYFVREKLEQYNLEKYSYLVHFGCTSEDINNVAYALMLNDCMQNLIIPSFEELSNNVKKYAVEYKDIPMLAHTHGQPATPTTVGKELAVFVYRWNSIVAKIKNIKLKGKFSGAVGNYSAHLVAYSSINWIEVTKKFIESFNIEYNPLTT